MAAQPSAMPAEKAPEMPGGKAAADKPLRADARRNRDRLVEVAASAFAEQGIDTPLEEIARRAGVGIGTLYRNFPTREHLVEIVYRREVEAVCAAAGELARQHPADVALEQWMQRFVDYIATKRGLSTSLRILITTNSTLFSDTSGRVSLALRGVGSTRLSPTDRFAATSTVPTCCTRCGASIPPPTPRTGATAPAGWSGC